MAETNRSFSSEALLQQAIAGLLIRMPNITGVRILQGTQELGKDLVFYTRGAFNEYVLCACVVKNKKITGDAAKSVGARTVLLQAQQAFDTPYVSDSGEDVYVQRVYVITPFDLTPATINSIKGKLNERVGQIVFTCGAYLFDLFREFWPDFLANEADAIEHHLRQTSKTLESNNPLAGVVAQYNLGSTEITSKKIYVPQRFHRELCAYVKGDILIDSIPSESLIDDKISLTRLRKTGEALKRFETALTYLTQWGYALPPQRTSEDVYLAIEKFTNALNKTWEDNIVKELGINRPKVYNLVPTASVTLKGAPGLKALLRDLNHKADEALVILHNALARLERVISRNFEEDVNQLSDLIFISACILDQCAQWAPDGIFRVRKRVHDKTIKKADVNFPKSLLDEWKGHLMIVGAPGFGKTSFCRWHALRDVERFNSNETSLLPVYIPLHRLGKGNLETFESAFLGNLGQSALLGRDNNINRGTQNVRLYLDGLDEIPSHIRRQEVIDLARKGASENPRFQFIVTARDHIAGPWLNWLPRVSLSGLDEAEIDQLINKWLGTDTEENVSFHAQLSSTSSLGNLMRTPLLATLIILVFKQTRRLPENKTKLYEIFTDLLSGGWDISKGIIRETKFGQRIKKLVLTALAGRIHGDGKRDFGNEDMKKVLKVTISPSLANEWELLRDELVEDGLITRTGDIMQFPHLSFQEFSAAKDLTGDPQLKQLRKALAAFLEGDDWWREVLHFYIGLAPKPREITLWLLREVDRIGDKIDDPLDSQRVDDLFAGVLESFPEFPLEDVVGHLPKYTRFKNNLTLSRSPQ